MPESSNAALARLVAMNATSPFNVWAGMTVTAAGDGEAELRMPWREEFAEYRGVLSSSLVQGFLETACGLAASTSRPTDGASHCAVSFLYPAAGDAFVARGKVVKAGRRQIFITGELFGERDGELHLLATATTIMISSPS
jgi:uncharacterized protein (TIGR00369 family)